MKNRNHIHSLQKLVTCGIILSAMTLMISLFCYFLPPAGQDAAGQTRPPVAETSTPISETQVPDPDAIPYMIPSHELGNILDLKSDNFDDNSPADDVQEPLPEPETIPPTEAPTQPTQNFYQNDSSSISMAMLDTAMGPMLYYSQGDKRWGNYLYGGADPMKKYGCGPTAVAMIVSSFSPQGYHLTPIDLADWAAANGGYAPQSGSYHSMIPKSLAAFGLRVEGVALYSEQSAAELLRSGHILVALMGKGALTKNGHFIVITKILDNGNVYIADPNSFENSTKEWNLAQLLFELKGNYDSGGPLWAVSYY